MQKVHRKKYLSSRYVCFQILPISFRFLGNSVMWDTWETQTPFFRSSTQQQATNLGKVRLNSLINPTWHNLLPRMNIPLFFQNGIFTNIALGVFRGIFLPHKSILHTWTCISNYLYETTLKIGHSKDEVTTRFKAQEKINSVATPGWWRRVSNTAS